MCEITSWTCLEYINLRKKHSRRTSDQCCKPTCYSFESSNPEFYNTKIFLNTNCAQKDLALTNNHGIETSVDLLNQWMTYDTLNPSIVCDKNRELTSRAGEIFFPVKLFQVKWSYE